jgi:hypothetical protein
MASSDDSRAGTARPLEIRTPFAPRPHLPTLIGVAPAAPVVNGRPSVPTKETESAETVNAAPPAAALHAHAHAEPPSSIRHKVVDDPQSQLPTDPMGIPPPKHTFDAISVGESASPAKAKPRGARGVLPVLAAAAAIGLVGFGTVSGGLPNVLAAAHGQTPSAPEEAAPGSEAEVTVLSSAALTPLLATVATAAAPPTADTTAPSPKKAHHHRHGARTHAH